MGEVKHGSLKSGITGLILLASLSACNTVGAGSGFDYAPNPFQDEGGVAAPASDSLPGQYLAGRQAIIDKDSEAAYSYFSNAYKLDPQDDFLLVNTFRTALSDGRLDVALELAREIEKRKLENIDNAKLVLATENIRDGKYQEALDQIESIHNGGFNILLKPVLKAWVLVGQGNLADANKALDELDKYDGFKLLKSYHLALLAHASGQVELAQQSYEAARQGPSGRAVRLVQSYGVFLMEQGKKDEARKLFEDYRNSFPLSPTINRLLADLDAGQEIRPLIANPAEGAAEALYSSAAIIGQERAREAAVTFAYFSLLLRPDLTVSKILLAEIAEDRRQMKKALAFYSEVPETSPYALNAQIRMAWLTYRLGDEEEALRRLEKMVRDNPSEVEPIIVLADLNRDKKNWSRAARAYGQAIDNIGLAKGRLWSLHYARGIAYERNGEWAKAEADLLKAMSLKPDHPQILNYLGYSWADRGEKLEEAKGLLIKAVSLRPRDGYIVDSLGWLYYRLEDFDNAVKQLEKAVSLQPEDPTINDHLGDAYWRVGREDEARYQWQRALWLEPEEDLIPVIEQKLETGLQPVDKVGQ